MSEPITVTITFTDKRDGNSTSLRVTEDQAWALARAAVEGRNREALWEMLVALDEFAKLAPS